MGEVGLRESSDVDANECHRQAWSLDAVKPWQGPKMAGPSPAGVSNFSSAARNAAGGSILCQSPRSARPIPTCKTSGQLCRHPIARPPDGHSRGLAPQMYPSHACEESQGTQQMPESLERRRQGPKPRRYRRDGVRQPSQATTEEKPNAPLRGGAAIRGARKGLRGPGGSSPNALRKAAPRTAGRSGDQRSSSRMVGGSACRSVGRPGNRTVDPSRHQLAQPCATTEHLLQSLCADVDRVLSEPSPHGIR